MLSQDALRLIDQLSWKLLEMGEPPIDAPRLTGVAGETFSNLKEALKDVPNPHRSHPAFDPDDLKAINFLQNAVTSLHVAMLTDRQKYFEAVKAKSENLHSALVKDRDEWGLVETTHLEGGDQWFSYQKQEVHLCQCIPGTTNSSLWLSELLCSSPMKNLFVRPDPIRMVPANTSWQRMERAAAFGRPFDPAWLKNLRKAEVAEHTPDPSNPLERGHRTQFIWEPKEAGKIQFAVEELPDDNSETVCTRFVHGIYLKDDERFGHFDGAIHIYGAADYLKRRSLHLKDHFKSYQKAKIFLMNGALDLDKGQSLMTAFYRWNTMPTEYFSSSGRGPVV